MSQAIRFARSLFPGLHISCVGQYVCYPSSVPGTHTVNCQLEPCNLLTRRLQHLLASCRMVGSLTWLLILPFEFNIKVLMSVCNSYFPTSESPERETYAFIIQASDVAGFIFKSRFPPNPARAQMHYKRDHLDIISLSKRGIQIFV